MDGRCPYATPLRCPRYFSSVSLVSKRGITTSLDEKTEQQGLAKWSQDELWPWNAESEPSAGIGQFSSFNNFCPEVSFMAFGEFARSLLRGAEDGDVSERLHYSDCPLFSLLSSKEEKHMAQINFNAPVTGNVNVAGHSISSPVMSLTLNELLTRIDDSNASTPDKEAAKGKLSEFLKHPVVAAILGGLASRNV